MKLTMTREDIRRYCRANQYSVMMFGDAGRVYLSSRCLNHNFFFSEGFPLFTHSVEKLLKSFVFLQTSKESKRTHKTILLKEKLTGDIRLLLDDNEDLLTRLDEYWNSRYFNNDQQANGMGQDELPRFDKLWISILKLIPYPPEVFYRMEFIANITGHGILGVHHSHWFRKNNRAVSDEYFEDLVSKFALVKSHLY